MRGGVELPLLDHEQMRNYADSAVDVTEAAIMRARASLLRDDFREVDFTKVLLTGDCNVALYDGRVKAVCHTKPLRVSSSAYSLARPLAMLVQIDSMSCGRFNP